ncbi:MAG: DsbA family protein [Paracoccaceae bacterium]
MENTLTAWISIGSTYTYLTALRLRSVAGKHNIRLNFRPFSVRQIMQSMNNIPFPPEKQTKVAYMWRDIERRAKGYGLPAPAVPAPYPLKDFDLINKLGIVANEDNFYLSFLEQTYSEWFVNGLPAGSADHIDHLAENLGFDKDALLARAQSDHVEAVYRENTVQAQNLGVFGAPSFMVGSEIFWGDDRLEDAISFLKGELS